MADDKKQDSVMTSIFGESDSDDSDAEDISFSKPAATGKSADLDELFGSSDDDSDGPPSALTPKGRLQKGKKAKLEKKANDEATPKKIKKKSEGGEESGEKIKKKKRSKEDKEQKKRKAERKTKLGKLKKTERDESMIPKKKQRVSKGKEQSKSSDGEEDLDAYDSGDEVKQSAADKLFIDSDDDNEELLAEYEKDNPQNFKDERPDGSDSENDGSGSDNERNRRGKEPSNDALDATLKSMKRPRNKEVSTKDKEELVQDFLYQMDKAWEEDVLALKEGRPATNKLKMLRVVISTLGKKTIQATLLDFDLLGAVKKWIQPSATGELGNLTLRQSVLQVLLQLPVNPEHLKRSGLGKVIMALWKHPDELKENKLLSRALIERWSRPLFHKETDLRQLGRIHEDRIQEARIRAAESGRSKAEKEQSTQRKGPINIFDREKGAEIAIAAVRARCPYSMGFNFVARPEPKISAETEAYFKAQRVNPESKKGKLNKLMVDKGRGSSKKSTRAVTVSIAAPRSEM